MLTQRQINAVRAWGSFPRIMRPYWLAQGGTCPYCGYQIPTLDYNDALGNPDCSTWDHVFPVSRGGPANGRANQVLSHHSCNIEKDDRIPYPCEIMFAAITADIVFEFVGSEGEYQRRPDSHYRADYRRSA